MKWYSFSTHPHYKIGGLQPYLHIRIIHPDDGDTSIILGALIDTGAVCSKIPVKWAEYINLDYKKGIPVFGSTAGGDAQGYLCKCRVQVLDMNEECEPLPNQILTELEDEVAFGPCVDIPLLGVRDFLKNYKITIDYPNKKFSLGSPK